MTNNINIVISGVFLKSPRFLLKNSNNTYEGIINYNKVSFNGVCSGGYNLEIYNGMALVGSYSIIVNSDYTYYIVIGCRQEESPSSNLVTIWLYDEFYPNLRIMKGEITFE